MSKVITISSDKHKKDFAVNIDGNIWRVRPPGAASELRFSQVSRDATRLSARLELLTKKIDSETATMEDLDAYDKASAEYSESEGKLLAYFKGLFKDETEDNSQVEAWINDTPMSVVAKIVNDIKQLADGGSDEQDPGQSSSAE